MAKELKRIMADEVRTDLEASPNLLVVGLAEMDAEKNHKLRSELRGQGARLRIVHNRTSRHALDEARKGLGDLFVGQTALALGEAETEFIPIAKILVDAAKKKTLELRGGYVDGELLDKAGLQALAACPDKPTLRAMLLGTINGSARGIAVSLSAVGGGIARCLQERIEKTGGEPGDE